MIVKQVLCVMVLLLTACQSVSERSDNLIYCPEVRSPLCTKIYRPVCGQDKAGYIKTYASACTACANINVVAYQVDACAGEIK